MTIRVTSPGEAIERAWRSRPGNRRINLATTADSVGNYHGMADWQLQQRPKGRLHKAATLATIVIIWTTTAYIVWAGASVELCVGC